MILELSRNSLCIIKFVQVLKTRDYLCCYCFIMAVVVVGGGCGGAFVAVVFISAVCSYVMFH